MLFILVNCYTLTSETSATFSKTFFSDNFDNFTFIFSESTDTITALASLDFNINLIENIPTLYHNTLLGTPAPSTNFDNITHMSSSCQFLETEIGRRHIKFPHLTRDEIWEIMTDEGSSAQMDMSLKLFDDLENTPIDYSNLYEYKGKILNVSELAPWEICKLAREVEDIDKFESLEHIRSMYIGTAPNVKLYYAEPFIASPSFIHNDLGYLHILQYQYWLWFCFIFLIVFYIVSFLCVVRWCANRNQPRRETRGVSRSKCGDLITAMVPVTWAISIIVSETTDATDVNDGFGTGEIIVGVRAYQWGWEYYYPKSIDLNYNIKPSYSTLIGNSFKYNGSTELRLNSNNVWKFYQNKVDDVIITPAHLLVLPLDNSKMFNFMNFDNIGANTLKTSNAFRKIRDHSKIYTTNLVATPSIFSDKYAKFNSWFTNENDLNNSFNYGLKRQHNLTSAAATANMQATFLDRKSMTKFLNYNLQYNTETPATNLFNQNTDALSKGNNSSTVISSVNSLNLLLESSNVYNSETLNFLALYPNLTKSIGDDVDEDVTIYPLRKVFGEYSTSSDLVNSSALFNSLDLDLTHSYATDYVTNNLDNPSTTFKDFDLTYEFALVQTPHRNVRLYNNLLTTTSNRNLASGFNSLDSNLGKLNSTHVSANPLYYHSWINTSWSDSNTFNKLASNRMFLDAPFSPLSPSSTINSRTSRINFDTSFRTDEKTIYQHNKIINKMSTKKGKQPLVFNSESKEPMACLSSNYWNMFWANTNPDFRIDAALSASLNQEFFYLPPFTNWDEYDFRNAQALEMLEEVFWETSCSTYTHRDYLNIADRATKRVDPLFYKFLFAKKYYIKNLNHKLSKSILLEPALKDISIAGKFYANNIQMVKYVSPAHLMNTKDFAVLPISNSLKLIKNTYRNQKNVTNLFSKNSSVLLNMSTNFNYPQSYISVLNNYQLHFGKFKWRVALSENSSQTILVPTTNYLVDTVLSNSDISQSNSTRFSNPIRLRSTARNSIVTYNAFQKVFRHRLEDGRSNIRLGQFANVRVTQPLMTGNRVAYEKLLGKNKESFYNTTFYATNSLTVLNDLASANNSLNTYFFDFPFLLSAMSDSAHFVWFDWYTKWSMVEVQPASFSKQSLAGVSYARRPYEFTYESGTRYIATEDYFTRIARARKNYLPVWNHTPYLSTRSDIWSAKSGINYLNPLGLDSFDVQYTLKNVRWYGQTFACTKNTSKHFTPSFSNSQKSIWRPYTSLQSHHYNIATLSDILTRREYLFRQYLEHTNKIINLPKNLTVNPQNTLLKEIKASFLLVDPIIFNSEYSREALYSSLTFFNYLLVKGWLLDWSEQVSKVLRINPSVVHTALGLDTVHTGFVADSLLWYFLSVDNDRVVGNNNDLYKSQYRPLKKGITNMLRLHGTGAVAMPIEIRLQILASSRDVIHSWAIPSAGIKIDCIPGYTSHRIMIFFTPGIYWGQCMEICGRYHHWMPIIVYFMKRDLFFLWCTHFMNKNDLTTTWQINDRQFTDYIRFVSYDKTAWLTELGRNM